MAERILRTERLILRPHTLSDARRIEELIGQAEVATKTLNIPHPYPPGEAERWLRGLPVEPQEPPERVHFAILERGSSELIGSIGLTVSVRHNHAEAGYWLGRAYWNRGYMTEALRAVLEYGFTKLGLHRICATYFPENPASRRVMEKAGMRYEGTLREHYRRDGAYRDAGYCGILRADWEAMRES